MATKNTTQISANISKETKLQMERYARSRGIKKGHLVEMALQHHLRALDELPLDVILPPTVLVSRASGDKILARIANPPAPTDAMKKLFDGDG